MGNIIFKYKYFFQKNPFNFAESAKIQFLRCIEELVFRKIKRLLLLEILPPWR